MDRIPSVWRRELWHPLCVHFPIATLLLATAAVFVAISIRRADRKAFYLNVFRALLAIGVVSGWLAVITGQRAYGIVVRRICDPAVLQRHSWWSYASLIAYTATAVWAFTAERLRLRSKAMLGVTAFVTLLAAGALAYSGHLGASVVYQQGGGTYKPSPDCGEFEQPN